MLSIGQGRAKEMCDTVLDNLTKYFGQGNALRIYACALIMTETNEKARGDIETGARLTIGALKRIRRNSGYGLIGWAKAIEKLENEQDEGRHYSLMGKSKLMLDVARIEKTNGQSYTSIVHGIAQEVNETAERAQAIKDNNDMAVAMIRTVLINAQAQYMEDEQAKQDVREYVAQYWESISKTKRKYLHNVLSQYNARQDIAEDVRKNISKRYAPKGVKPLEFIELLARYAV